MNEGWILICVISFWSWVAAVIGLIVTAFPDRNTFCLSPAVKWGAAMIGSYIVWIIGMTQA